MPVFYITNHDDGVVLLNDILVLSLIEIVAMIVVSMI